MTLPDKRNRKFPAEEGSFTMPVLKEIRNFWVAGNLALAVEKFEQGAAGIALPRLHEAYRWLKDEIDCLGEEFTAQGDLLSHVFLRIMEGRRETDDPLYRTVLRESGEYRVLSSLLEYERSRGTESENPLLPAPAESVPEKKVKPKNLKQVLDDMGTPLSCYDVDQWYALTADYMKHYVSEEKFVKRCGAVIRAAGKRDDSHDYHTELIIVYAFERLISFRKLSVASKTFAMDILNLMSSRGETWKRLHEEYLNIIKK